MYNIILFDLDGTLTDPGIGITNSVAYALKRDSAFPINRLISGFFMPLWHILDFCKNLFLNIF